MPTRLAYVTGLIKLGKVNPQMVVLDAELKNSTYTEEFLKEFPDRFFECYIAEQNMVGMAMGFSALGKIPFCSTFGLLLHAGLRSHPHGVHFRRQYQICRIPRRNLHR